MADKIHFSPAEQKIIDILRDYEWHCLSIELLMKDDRARLTSIRRKLQERGYDVNSELCNKHNHSSRILMRRIEKLPAPKPILSPYQTPLAYKDS